MPKSYHPQVADSVSIPQPSDTIAVLPSGQDSIMFSQADSLSSSMSIVQDSVSRPIAAENRWKSESQKDTTILDSVSIFPYDIEWNSNRNFLAENPLSGVQLYQRNDSTKLAFDRGTASNLEGIAVMRRIDHGDWLTGLGLLILFLLIWIRIFYGKFYAQLADSITNYQISAKLYLEKNILTRRVSFVLDIVYFIVFALFIYELAIYSGILATETRDIVLFGMILGMLLAYSIARFAMLRLTGFVFQNDSLFTEYIHHTYIFNKGLGMVLFPVVILLVYIPPGLTLYVLTMGAIIYLLTFVLKTVRAFKIIIKKDILIYYMILYLCTLEILPLLLGYKVLKSLILSY